MATLRQWLKQYAKDLKPGDPVYIAVRGNKHGDYTCQSETVKTVGRSDITINDFVNSRFSVVAQDFDYLLQDCDSGLPSYLFLSEQRAKDYIQHQQLLVQFRREAAQLAEKASPKRLAYTVMLLNGEIPEEDIPAVTRRDGD